MGSKCLGKNYDRRKHQQRHMHPCPPFQTLSLWVLLITTCIGLGFVKLHILQALNESQRTGQLRPLASCKCLKMIVSMKLTKLLQ
jgi:hypothetical protein